jgi:uncharacterized membrane protein YfcA
MGIIGILTICSVSFVVAIVSVAVGGTSLITVPVLMWFGMLPRQAIATNMFALIFLSLSGTIGFRKELNPKHAKIILILSILTVCGSLIGAELVLSINENILKKVIAAIMCIIAVSLIFKKDLGLKETQNRDTIKFLLGIFSVFILGIYGGFFSGGYVTLLSYILIISFGLNFLQTVFITRTLKVFSSIAACAFFYYYNLIDFSVAIPMATSMFLGAFIGAKLAIAKGNLWVRNLFVIIVIILATKLLLF